MFIRRISPIENNEAVKSSQNPSDIFVTGSRKGFHIVIHNLMPNVVMAYMPMEVLNLLGIMPFLGQVFVPVIGLFGLPVEATTVLLTA